MIIIIIKLINLKKKQEFVRVCVAPAPRGCDNDRTGRGGGGGSFARVIEIGVCAFPFVLSQQKATTTIKSTN